MQTKSAQTHRNVAFNNGWKVRYTANPKTNAPVTHRSAPLHTMKEAISCSDTGVCLISDHCDAN